MNSKEKIKIRKRFYNSVKVKARFFFRATLAFVCNGYEALLLLVHLNVQVMKQCVNDALGE